MREQSHTDSQRYRDTYCIEGVCVVVTLSRELSVEIIPGVGKEALKKLATGSKKKKKRPTALSFSAAVNCQDYDIFNLVVLYGF